MKIFFAILLVVCIIFYVMYLWDFALVLMVTVAAVPLIMFVTGLISKKNISVSFAIKKGAVIKGENFPVQVMIENGSIFPVGKAVIQIEYFNCFSTEPDYFTMLAPIQAKNKQSVSFQLKSDYCGLVCINCAAVEIYDPLRIFRFTTARNIYTEIMVMPECHEIGGKICSADRINDESDVFSEYKAGDDPSEIFDLRNYNAGDRLNRIHWKLSSKKDDFIVKDYSLPVDTPCTVFLDLNVYSEYPLAIFDTLIETLLSVSQFMLDNERIHSVVYYNTKFGEFVEKTVTDTGSLDSLIKEIFRSFDDYAECGQPQEYFTSDGPPLSSLVLITSETDETIFDYIVNNVDADIKNGVLVVASPEETGQFSDEYADMNIIPVVVGRISSSIRDIEL